MLRENTGTPGGVSLRANLKILHQKSVCIGRRVNVLARGGSAAMSAGALNPQQDGRRLRLGCLQRGGELKRVSGHDARAGLDIDSRPPGAKISP